MDHLEAWDPRFWSLVDEDSVMEHVATGFRTTEGPVWRGDHLVFTDIPRSRIVRLRMLPEGPEIVTFADHTGNANGLAPDREGQLICCEQGARRVTRRFSDGSVSVLADQYQGKRLNSPNDVIVHSSGAIYFTDPPYGLRDGIEGKELDFNGVFRINTDDSLICVTAECNRPNGLCFSPDERTLYVADTPAENLHAYDVRTDGSLAGGRIFADLASSDLGRPDGVKVDCLGNVYCTGGGGIRVLSSTGEKLGRIKTSEHCRNLAFGDPDGRMLYITAGGSVYRIRMRVSGIGPTVEDQAASG